ncbi:hypothetical protein PS861_03059 [Pseudomonas fluorescens]|nr:hypothetical protein PS861_03059 [Pseudomonas fluorescens]
MVAGIWFQQMSESDLRRAIGPCGVLILLLLAGFVPFLQMTVAFIPAVLDTPPIVKV